MAVPNVTTVSVAPTEVSVLTLSDDSLQRANKIQQDTILRLNEQASSDNENLFESSDEDAEAFN